MWIIVFKVKVTVTVQNFIESFFNPILSVPLISATKLGVLMYYWHY